MKPAHLCILGNWVVRCPSGDLVRWKCIRCFGCLWLLNLGPGLQRWLGKGETLCVWIHSIACDNWCGSTSFVDFWPDRKLWVVMGLNLFGDMPRGRFVSVHGWMKTVALGCWDVCHVCMKAVMGDTCNWSKRADPHVSWKLRYIGTCLVWLDIFKNIMIINNNIIIKYNKFDKFKNKYNLIKL